MNMPDQRSPDQPDRRRQNNHQAQDERNQLLHQLDNNVSALNKSADGLRERLNRRPTGAELAFKRRRIVATMLVCMVTIIFVHDTHVEHCGPGARAEAAIDAIVNAPAGSSPPGQTLEEVQKLTNQQPPRPLCDLTFPLHGHDGTTFPSSWALAGAMLYVIGAALLYLWTRPRPQPKEDS